MASFLGQMEKLKELSLLDSERSLVRLTGNLSPGDKVLVYSAFKRAILDREHQSTRKKSKGSDGEVIVIDDSEEDEEKEPEPAIPLATDLRAISVVDRCLKPFFLPILNLHYDIE